MHRWEKMDHTSWSKWDELTMFVRQKYMASKFDVKTQGDGCLQSMLH